MGSLKDLQRSVLAFGAAMALAGAPAVAEPYLFSSSPRPPGAAMLNDYRAPQPFSLPRRSGQYGRSTLQPYKSVAARTTPSPRKICRRLVRDARYGYVELQFAC